jgi:hypothetical protein
VLHPDQIAAANEIFSPSQEDYDHAELILDAYDWYTSAEGGARGAAMLGDEMIGEASRKMGPGGRGEGPGGRVGADHQLPATRVALPAVPAANRTTRQAGKWSLPAGRLPPNVNGMSTLTATQTTGAGAPAALPLAATRATAGLVALALLIQPAVSTVTRWLAGRYGDRHGSAGLIIRGVVVSAAGMLMLALTTAPAAVIGGAVVFGAGFGVAQNATLSLMYARVPESGYGTVSALWNLAYDAGMGLGAAGFGVVAAQAGYPASFALTVALMLAALAPALRDRHAGDGRHAGPQEP